MLYLFYWNFGNMLFIKVDSNWCFYVIFMFFGSDINIYLLFFDSDFVCRNCLVMFDLLVKVGDYGVVED